MSSEHGQQRGDGICIGGALLCVEGGAESKFTPFSPFPGRPGFAGSAISSRQSNYFPFHECPVVCNF